MDFAVIIGVIVGIIALPTSAVGPEALAEFGRLQRHVGQEVVVVDGTGLVMEGRLLAARPAEIDLGFGGRVQSMAASNVVRVDRRKDPWVDGLVKGVLVGGLLGVLSENTRVAANSIALWGSVGFLLDFRHDARQPIYRARDPHAPKAVVLAATIRW